MKLPFNYGKSAPLLLVSLLVAGTSGNALAEPHSASVDKIIVSATKTPHTLGDVPVAAEVITREELLERNVRTVPEALEQVTGIVIDANSGSWGDKGKAGLQGLDPSHSLVLVDGQRILGGHENAVDLQQISIDMIERIEIVKGSASALYGSDAIGGVINIITRKAPSGPEFSGSLAMGSRGTTEGSFSAGAGSKTVKGRLQYTYRESDTFDEVYRYGEHILQGTVSFDLAEHAGLDIKPYYSYQEMPEEERTQERQGLNVLYNWEPDDRSSLRVRGSYFDYQQWTADRSTDYSLDNYEFEIGYSRMILDRHLLTAGYEFWLEKRDDEGKDLDIDQELHSVYLQDEIDLAPVVVVLGARLDAHEEWGEEINPKASLMYTLSEGLKLRASVGTAFKAPSLLKLYGDGWMMGPFLMHSNPELEPEKSVGYQAGIEYAVNRDVDAEVSFFRNDIEDLIVERIVYGMPLPFDIYWENVEKAMTQGVEVNLKTRLSDGISARIGYTWLDTEDKDTGNELTYRPEHKLFAGLDFRIRSAGLGLHLETKYTGERWEDDDNTLRLDDYWICNASLTKELGEHVQAFVRVDNIFDERNIEDEYDIDGIEFLAGVRMRL